MFDDLTLYPEYERGVARMGIPFFQVAGNHDLDFSSRTTEGAIRTFEGHFGPGHFSFDRGAAHYVVLNNVFWHGAGYLGYLTETQLRWLANDLAFVEAGRPVIVALHIPVLGGRHGRIGQRNPAVGISTTNRQELYRLLKPYQAHILTGHTHENEHVFHEGTHEHVQAAVCGAWWSGPICADGTPNGYSVYEIRGEEVTWRYKCTGYDFDHQMRVYPHGSDPNAPDEIVANVWDWDPEWRVVWYEDGERRGSMARRVGTDPLSEELHRGDDKPPRRRWVDPYPIEHLFYAPASRNARESGWRPPTASEGSTPRSWNGGPTEGRHPGRSGRRRRVGQGDLYLLPAPCSIRARGSSSSGTICQFSRKTSSILRVPRAWISRTMRVRMSSSPA